MCKKIENWQIWQVGNGESNQICNALMWKIQAMFITLMQYTLQKEGKGRRKIEKSHKKLEIKSIARGIFRSQKLFQSLPGCSHKRFGSKSSVLKHHNTL